MKKTLIILSLILLFKTSSTSLFSDIIAGLKSLWTTQQTTQNTQEITELAFELIDTEGNVYSQNTVKGKYLIINFWATWCSPCLKEIPVFIEFYKNNANKIEILGLNYESLDYAVINEFKERFKINYPVILYTGSNKAQYSNFGDLRGMPTTLIYNPDGKLVHTFIGAIGIKELMQFIALES